MSVSRACYPSLLSVLYIVCSPNRLSLCYDHCQQRSASFWNHFVRCITKNDFPNCTTSIPAMVARHLPRSGSCLLGYPIITTAPTTSTTPSFRLHHTHSSTSPDGQPAHLHHTSELPYSLITTQSCPPPGVVPAHSFACRCPLHHPRHVGQLGHPCGHHSRPPHCSHRALPSRGLLLPRPRLVWVRNFCLPCSRKNIFFMETTESLSEKYILHAFISAVAT